MEGVRSFNSKNDSKWSEFLFYSQLIHSKSKAPGSLQGRVVGGAGEEKKFARLLSRILIRHEISEGGMIVCTLAMGRWRRRW